MLKLKCNNCDIVFVKNKDEYNRQTKLGRLNFFCSLSCGAKSQRKREYQDTLNIYNSDPNKCIECFAPLSYKKRNNKTCGYVCRGRYTNKCISNATPPTIIKKCKICSNTAKKTYCSKKCGGIDKKRITCDKLRNDKYIGINNASNTIRKSLIQIRGHACEECKNTRWKNLPINLTLHHINGDSKMNTLDNLLLLCWNCHSYTPNYGRKNLYSTRKDRRR